MKKILLFISLIAVASLFFACNKQKTPQELLKEEKKAIERFIAKNEIIVTNNPDEMYQDKVFYKTKEGLYIHVIESGNENKAKYNQEIVVRYNNFLYIKSGEAGVTDAENESAHKSPIVYRYNNSNTYYDLSCYGFDIGLSLVSENAAVSLIIPSELQSTGRQGSFEPIYFGYLKYRFK